MKTTLLTLSLTLIAGLAVAGPDGGKPGKDGKPGHDHKAMDPAKRAEMMMKKLDTDSDGKISKAEFAAGPMGKRMTEKRGDEAIDKFFGRVDKDGDGNLTEEELAAMPAHKKGGKKGGEGKKPKKDS